MTNPNLNLQKNSPLLAKLLFSVWCVITDRSCQETTEKVSSSLFKMEGGQFGPRFRGSLNGERRNACWTTKTPWLPPQITICRNDECVLKENAQRTKWKVISPAGNEATVPSVCFLVPPPNSEAIEMASR